MYVYRTVAFSQPFLILYSAHIVGWFNWLTVNTGIEYTIHGASIAVVRFQISYAKDVILIWMKNEEWKWNNKHTLFTLYVISRV